MTREPATSVLVHEVPRAPQSTERGRLLAAIDSIEEILACAALVIVVLAVAWGVITRYVTAQPAPWTGEVSGIAFAWVVFLGAAAGFKRGLHASIDLLTAHLPPALGRALTILVDLGVLAFAAYVTWLGIEFTGRNLDNPSSVLRVPMSIIYLAVTLGFASITFRQAVRLVRDLWLGKRMR
jgi:TRAP-type C4-dicarboxylate transport system permease small subunit